MPKFLILNKEAQTIFNNRKTLLEQLIATESALNDALTVSVSVVPLDVEAGSYQIVFADASGGKLATNSFILPSGKDGVGVSSFETISNSQSGLYTLTTIKVTKTDGTTEVFNVYALSGTNGASIQQIEADSDEQQDGYTVTPIQVNMSDGTRLNFEIRAKNGVAGKGITSVQTGIPYKNGNQTITPLTINYNDGTTENITVSAENGTNNTSEPIFVYTLKFVGARITPSIMTAYATLMSDISLDVGTTYSLGNPSDNDFWINYIFAGEYPYLQANGYVKKTGNSEREPILMVSWDETDFTVTTYDGTYTLTHDNDNIQVTVVAKYEVYNA